MDAATAARLAVALADRLRDLSCVAVGATSPLPATAALLARARAEDEGGRLRTIILGSLRHTPFTDGGRELFDCAAQGRIDAFFLSGGQIDGEGSVNLVGTGPYPALTHRFPGSFGSAYLAYLIPRVILFREEHSRRVLVPRVDFVSAPGTSEQGVYRPGGPTALVTGRCVFAFDRERRRFRLESLHAGETVAGIREHTGFDFDLPGGSGDAGPAGVLPVTPAPGRADQELLRGRVAAEVGETYPRFGALIAAV
jgi:glutaconate CoA-transferase subunit B